jgi:hypothetical protein
MDELGVKELGKFGLKIAAQNQPAKVIIGCLLKTTKSGRNNLNGLRYRY